MLAGVGSIPSNLGIQNRYKYFAPRLGFAYRVTDKTVIRSGFGISYTPFPDNNYAYNFPVRANNQYTAANAYVPAVLNTGQPASFQNGFPARRQSGHSVQWNHYEPVSLTQQYNVVSPTFKNPYVETWNFAIQQALPQKFVLDLAYVGNHGVDSVVNYNLNAGYHSGRRRCRYGRSISHTVARTADTNLLFAPYSTSYNSLQVKLDRRFSDLNITTAFTWAKGLGFQDGDDCRAFLLCQSEPQLRPQQLRPQIHVRSKLCL